MKHAAVRDRLRELAVLIAICHREADALVDQVDDLIGETTNATERDHLTTIVETCSDITHATKRYAENLNEDLTVIAAALPAWETRK